MRQAPQHYAELRCSIPAAGVLILLGFVVQVLSPAPASPVVLRLRGIGRRLIPVLGRASLRLLPAALVVELPDSPRICFAVSQHGHEVGDGRAVTQRDVVGAFLGGRADGHSLTLLASNVGLTVIFSSTSIILPILGGMGMGYIRSLSATLPSYFSIWSSSQSSRPCTRLLYRRSIFSTAGEMTRSAGMNSLICWS